MKQNKTICLEYDLIDKLRSEGNSSELISRLLNKHYQYYDKTDKQIIDEVKDKIQAKVKKKTNERLNREIIKKEKSMGFEHV